MIKIEMPEVSKLISVEEVLTIPEMNGIYYLYNFDNELIYLGKSKNIRGRLLDHVRGTTHTCEYHKEFYRIRYSIISSELETEIYETYLINKLNPKYNVAKRYSDDKSQSHLYIEEDEKRKFVNFVIKLLKLNKNISLGRFTIEQLCQNNNIKFYNFYDKLVYDNLLKHKISITPNALTLNKR